MVLVYEIKYENYTIAEVQAAEPPVELDCRLPRMVAEKAVLR